MGGVDKFLQSRRNRDSSTLRDSPCCHPGGLSPLDRFLAAVTLSGIRSPPQQAAERRGARPARCRRVTAAEGSSCRWTWSDPLRDRWIPTTPPLDFPAPSFRAQIVSRPIRRRKAIALSAAPGRERHASQRCRFGSSRSPRANSANSDPSRTADAYCLERFSILMEYPYAIVCFKSVREEDGHAVATHSPPSDPTSRPVPAHRIRRCHGGVALLPLRRPIRQELVRS